MDKVSCGVCTEEYWTGLREPLMLPCGHTYCRQCVLSLIQARQVECPNCRRIHRSVVIDKLPKNFALLSIAVSENMLDSCSLHGDPLRFWCSDCQERGCGECMFHSHPKDSHHVVNIRFRLHEKKEALRNQVDQFLRETEQVMVKRKSSFKRCEENMLRLLQENQELCNLNSQLRDTLDGIDMGTDLISLNSLEAGLRKLQEKTDEALSRLDDDDDEGEIADGSRSWEGAAASRVPSPLGMEITMFGGRESGLFWQDDRLLLCTTPRKSQRRPVKLLAMECLVTMEMPEVFLELSVGQMTLGKVYIKLWNRLRRAQHFLALCLGTFGPSFVGAKFLEVFRRSDPEESVTCGDYKATDGTFTAKPMMTDLEWDGEYAGERCEGLVVASSGGDKELDSRFGISTSRRAHGRVRCPFGQVVSGLKVVRTTLIYNPVSQVRVSGCGLVLKQ